MKKVLFFVAVLFATVAFTSCAKDWSCDCTIAGLPEVKNPILDQKKADAKDACDALETAAKLIDDQAKCVLN